MPTLRTFRRVQVWVLPQVNRTGRRRVARGLDIVVGLDGMPEHPRLHGVTAVNEREQPADLRPAQREEFSSPVDRETTPVAALDNHRLAEARFFPSLLFQCYR